MIHTRFSKSEDGKTLILTVQGHAGQAEEGQDTICAAASILAYTVAQVVSTMHKEGKLKKKPNIRLEKGDAVVTCKATKQYYAEALHTYSVAQVGYELLRQNFPEYVQLVKFGEDK